MPDPAAADAPDGALDRLSEEVATLRDLFQRRLLEDRSKQRLYDELYQQLAFARAGLADQYLTPMIREILLVVDRLEASAEQVSTETREVLDSVLAELSEVLVRRGVRRVDVRGERFDPRLHEAVGRVPVADEEQEGRVIEVRRHGYLIEDRLVRPAQVIVGARPGKTRRSDGEEAT